MTTTKVTTGVRTLAANEVVAANIATGAVETAKIAANAVDGEKISIASEAQGDLLWYDGTNWARVPKGTAGQLLQGNTTSIPTWVAATSAVPSGSILDYAGATAPGTWVLCDGAAYNSVSDTTFADLYTALGNLYGGSDGTDFQVPDLRGRVVVGQDDMGGTSANRIVETEAHGVNGDTLGAVGGAGEHAITTAQMAPHDHGSGGGHSHTYTHSDGTGEGTTGTGTQNLVNATTSSAGAHTHTSVGSGNAHTNLQPSMILNKIIKK